MKSLRLFVFITLALLVAACSQLDRSQTPTLSPQLGPSGTTNGFGVVTNQAGTIYAVSSENSAYYDEETNEDVIVQAATLSRYNRSGVRLWQYYIYGGTCRIEYYYDFCSNSYMLDLAGDGVGNTYAMWELYQESCDVASVSIHTEIVKVNSSGTRVLSFDVTSAVAFARDNSGNIYTVGSNDTGYGDYCDGTDTDPPFAYTIRKYNTNGSLVWERPFAPDIGYPRDIAVASNGNIFVAGSDGLARHGTTGGVWWQKRGGAEEIIASGSTLMTRSGLTVRSLNHSGRQLWSKFIGGLSEASLGQIDNDVYGNTYVTGSYAAGANRSNTFVRKLGASGNTQWTRLIGTPENDFGNSVETYNGSEIYVVGRTDGNLSPANASSNAFLYKMNGQGNRVWVR